jgi:TonB family protein
MNAVNLTTQLFVKSTVSTAAVLLATFAVLSAPTAQAHDSDTCRPVVKSARTDFPTAAQRGGAHGAVVVSIRIDSHGRAQDATVVESSGFSKLDQAAIDSVRKHWEFDISNCTAADLQREQTASVEFVRAKSATLYATRDAHAIAKAREWRTNQQCYSAEVDANETVFSCFETAEQIAAKGKAPNPQLQATR